MPIYLTSEQIHLAVDNVMQNFHGIKQSDFTILEVRLERVSDNPGQITKVLVQFIRTEKATIIDALCEIDLDDEGHLMGYIEDQPAGEKHD